MPEREAKAVAYTRIRYATFFLERRSAWPCSGDAAPGTPPLREWAERQEPGLRDALFTSSR